MANFFGPLFSLSALLLVCGCAVQRVEDSTVRPVVNSEMKVFENEFGFVIAHVVIRNLSDAMICVPQSVFRTNPWPFRISDEAGRLIVPSLVSVYDDFGLGNESFYVIGTAKNLTMNIVLSSVVDFTPGQHFQVEWSGYAFDCNDIANGGEVGKELAKFPVVELSAKAVLGR